MYAVRLVSADGRQRFLSNQLIFENELSEASLFVTTSDALRAVHARGYEASRRSWPTGQDVLQIVEVVTQPVVGRVVA